MAESQFPPQSSSDFLANTTAAHSNVQFDSSEPSVGGVVTALTSFAVMFVLAAVFGGLLLHMRRSSTTPSEVTSQYSVPSDALPAEPRLEPIDRAEGIMSSDVFVRQRAAEAMLHSYGNTADPQYVHIPIEQAMSLVVKSLPMRSDSPDANRRPVYGLLDDGEPNSGRLFSKGPPWLGHTE